MPIWNGGTGSITAAEVQAACEAAIVAENLPSQAEVQTACEAAITAAGIPTALEVQAACEDALTAQAGVAVPSVAQIQTGLSTSVEVAAVQAAVDLLPSAADVATAVGAQAAAQAAITASIGTALVTSAQVQTSCEAAITASVGAEIPDLAQIQTACETAIAVSQVATVADVDNIAPAVQTLAVGSFAQKTTVTISGAGTSGTLIAAGGVGVRTYIVGILVSCTVGNSTMQLVSTGGVSTGVHSILLNNNLSMSLPFGIIARSGSNTAITCNKTASQTLIFDVWYYQGA